MKKAPPKSTLAYANIHRPAELFRDLFFNSLASFRARNMLGIRKPFRFKHKLMSFDSTTISLALSAFPWAKFRTKKGGVKLYVLLDNADLMPEFVHMTEARMHGCKALSMLSLKAGTIIVMDRAYNDYSQFGDWCMQGVYFVTRMKSNTKFSVIEKRIPPAWRHILSDELIVLTGDRADRCPDTLRLVFL